jgi:hypothetical protein
MKTALVNTYAVAANGGAYPKPDVTPQVVINPTRTRILAGQTSQGPAPGVSGSGWLCSFTFHVLDDGETTLDIDHTMLGQFTYIINNLGETVGDDASGIGDPGNYQSELLKESGHFSNTGPMPTELKFSLIPNPVIVGQPVSMLGNLTAAGSPIGGASLTIKLNGSPVGTLTTNATGWFTAGAPAPSEGNYTIRVEYGGSTEYLPSYDEHVLVVEVGGLSIEFYTDKYTYHTGDTMHLGLNVSNTGTSITVDFKIWIELPGGGTYVYEEYPSVTIPAGLDYSNPSFDTITLPSIPSGVYTWHAECLEPSTTTIIVDDTAEFEFT